MKWMCKFLSLDTGCISSYSEKENGRDNVIEITNFINTFIVLDIVMVI